MSNATIYLHPVSSNAQDENNVSKEPIRSLSKNYAGSVVLHKDGDPGIVVRCNSSSWQIHFCSGYIGDFQFEPLLDPETFAWIPKTVDINRGNIPFAKQLEDLAEVFSLLKRRQYDAADKAYISGCAIWWLRENYEGAKNNLELSARDAQYKDLKVKVLAHLEKGKIEQADLVFNESCSDWWESSDYDWHRGRALAINEVISNYDSCSLGGLNTLLSDSHLRLGSSEIATLKLPKLDVFLVKHGIELDQEQRLACVRPEQNLLIRARAGAGKTRTLATIAALAIYDESVNSDQVMILAFNKKAAVEIGERVKATLGKDYRNARTFHSLAYQLANHAERELIFDDGSLRPSRRKQSRFVEKVIHAVLSPVFRDKLYEFFRHEVEQVERIGSNLKGEEYFSFRRSMTEFSLGGDNVKSNGEKFISDFLFEHGITYTYEKPYAPKDKQHRFQGAAYRPDFSLLYGGQDLIWEHWGLDPDDPKGVVPDWWSTSTEEYREQIHAKRRFWNQRNITLIETHAGMLRGGRVSFEQKLIDLLLAHDIKCQKLQHDELIRRLMEGPRTISRISDLFLAFISRSKKRGWSVEVVAEVIAGSIDTDPRSRIFHELAVRAYSEYERMLALEKAWDFDDMLMSATSQVKSHGDLAEIGLGHRDSVKLRDLRWILIDEFQDFSELYCQLIHSILEANPRIRIVAVGDDWQAINGFAGAQLAFFDDFGTFFSDSGLTNISTNYRSDIAIVNAGNKIMQGHGQVARPKFGVWPGFVAACNVETVRLNSDDEFDRSCLEAAKSGTAERINYELAKSLKVCADFIADSVFEQDGCRWLPNVLVMARTGRTYGLEHSDFKSRLLSVLEHHPCMKLIENDIHLEVMTAHKAKGKEAHTAILLEVTSKQFPKIHADNQLFGPFGVTIEDVLAEERRLFYVALTRAEQRLLLLSEGEKESPFLMELSDQIPFHEITEIGEDFCDGWKYEMVQTDAQLSETALTISKRINMPHRKIFKRVI